MSPAGASAPRTRPWQHLLGIGILLGIWWAFSGIWVIQQNETGVVQTFGAVSRVVPGGIHFTLPAPFERLTRVATSDVRSMTVGFSLDGDVSSDRAGATDPEFLTGDTNIVDLNLVVQYRVSDPEAYLFEVAECPDGPRDLAVRKLAEAELTRLVAAMPIDEVLSSGKARLQRAAKLEIQARLDELGYGITLLAANLSEVAPPVEVIDFFNDVTSAESDRERVLSEADGYGRDLIPGKRAEAQRILRDAETYRDEVVNRARGEAERFTSLAAEIQASPELSRRRLLLEALTKLLASGEQLVYTSRQGRPFVLRLVE